MIFLKRQIKLFPLSSGAVVYLSFTDPPSKDTDAKIEIVGDVFQP